MNAHNKTQFTYARINSILKDSNCDTPSPKILMLTILATCASSSLTKVSKCPHESDTTLTLKKRNTMYLTQDQKGLSKACNGAECKYM
ncbi:hypothetical protein H5410_015726, partial [Solanum commersonii]